MMTMSRCPYPQCRQDFTDRAALDEHLILVTRHDDPDHREFPDGGLRTRCADMRPSHHHCEHGHANDCPDPGECIPLPAGGKRWGQR
jgi:hypothetical protein